MAEGLFYNYLALMVSICTDKSPEQAFKALECKGGALIKQKKTKKTPYEIKEMIAMWNKGMSYREIARHFGVTHNAIRYWVKKYEREKES